FRIATYRWDGRRFVLAGTKQEPVTPPPGHAPEYYRLQEGQRLLDDGRCQEAIPVFEAAGQSSEAWLCCYYLGISHAMVGHYEEAVTQLRRAAQLAATP